MKVRLGWLVSAYLLLPYAMAENDCLTMNNCVNQQSVASQLSVNESNGIRRMQEEEKFAHDVYTVLQQKWPTLMLSNIIASEHNHQQVMNRLAGHYGVSVQVFDAVGRFHDPELQSLYTQLVAEGSKSQLAALKVGAKIEEMDIADLKRLESETQRSDIQRVYQQLNRGSRNHLRSFVRQIQLMGGEYQPQYLSSSDYQAIISSGVERGNRRGWMN